MTEKLILSSSKTDGYNISSAIPTSSATRTKLGEIISVQLNEQAYKECLALYKHPLITRVILAKGEVPWKLNNLKATLSKIWNLATWRLISIGKGYFQVLLHSEEEKNVCGREDR